MDNITIHTTARIHTGLLNESGYLGRIDGGIGFAVDSPGWKIFLCKGLKEGLSNNIEAEILFELELFKSKMQIKYNLPDFSYSVSGGIDVHIGLGSKTSLLIGFGNAINKLFELNLSCWDIAKESGRGGTSGIGFWASQKGGVLWDAGRKFPEEKATFAPSSCSNAFPPELIASIDLPGFYACHFRYAEKGIYGSKERSLFDKYCPTSHEDTKNLLALVSGLLVPSLISKCEQGIQVALKGIQSLGLKAIEWDHQSSETLDFRKFWDSNHTETALCLSSMGPTMYCLTQHPNSIIKIIKAYSVRPLHFRVSKILSDTK